MTFIGNMHHRKSQSKNILETFFSYFSLCNYVNENMTIFVQ